MKLVTTFCVVLMCALSSTAMAADPKLKIALMAIFKDKVIVKINGSRVILKKDTPGPDGVTLRFTDTRGESADIEIAGKVETMPLGFVMSGSATSKTSTEKQNVTLYSGANGFFHADGYINGTPVRFLVDTGANTVAMNATTANRVGIDYRRGEKAVAVTASGYAEIFVIDLEEVEIGGLKLRYVKASVTEGPQPDVPLLGMSFLGAFDMKREGDRMELMQR